MYALPISVLEVNFSRQDTGIAIGVIAVPVTVGTAAIFIIIFMVVASICLYVGRAKQKRTFFLVLRLCLNKRQSRLHNIGQKSIPITENTR